MTSHGIKNELLYPPTYLPTYLPITPRCLETAEGVRAVQKYDKMMELLDRCAIPLNQSPWLNNWFNLIDSHNLVCHQRRIMCTGPRHWANMEEVSRKITSEREREREREIPLAAGPVHHSTRRNRIWSAPGETEQYQRNRGDFQPFA